MENRFEFFGDKLLKYRKEKGLSQEELADKINVSRQSIHLWEAGKIVPDMPNIINLCNVLEITTDELTNGLKIISKSKINKSKFIHIIKVILIIFLIIYLCISIRKSIILMGLNNKLLEYHNLDSYSYTINYFEASTNSLLPKNMYTNSIYFKDKICKNIYMDSNTYSTTIRNYKENEKYIFDENNKTYRKDLDYESYILENNSLPVGKSGQVTLGEKYQIINFLHGFIPNLKITSNDKEYIFQWSTKVLDLKKDVEEIIDKETGLIKQKNEYINDNIYCTTIYEININTVSNEDIKMPNIEEYINIE